MELKVKKLSDKAIIPTRANKGDAGFDLYSTIEIIIPPQKRVLIPTDIAMAIPEGFYGRIADRSGVAYKKGLHTFAGVIDETYRGNVGVILFNSNTDASILINENDRIAQIIIEQYFSPDIKEVNSLEETVRGERRIWKHGALINMTFHKFDETFLNQYKNKQPNWGFNGLGYIVYKRTYSRIKENGENEEWWETIQRCIEGAQKIGADYTKVEAERLFDHIFNLRCNFAGRMLWQLGTSTVDRFGLPSMCNCWFTTITKPEDFCFLFEHLMLGGGVGFSIKREHIHELPKVKHNVAITANETKDADFIVPDSREGWVEIFRKVLDSIFNTGKSFTYSTILVRGYGEKINGFGGTASGPKFLIEMIDSTLDICNKRVGKKLRSIDVLDICNCIGSCVVSGNVRRTAELAIGDPDDYLYLRAKNWSLGNIPNWRAMSNNSIYADSYNQISDEIWKNGYEIDKNTGASKGEAYGFINIDLARKKGRLKDNDIKDNCEGFNPCQPGWAPILTKNGIKTIKDLNIGDEIWSETGWTNVTNKWSTGIKKVYKYGTTAGCFYGTENHRLVSNGEKLEAKNCESIDTLCGEYKNSNILNIQDIMDGLIIGDGSVHKASNNLVHLCVGSDDKDYFESEISELIGKYRPGVHDFAYEIETTISSGELPLTYLRQIPNRFLMGGRDKVAAFLRGLYSANGSICGDRVTLKTASSKLKEQVQLMLSSLGIHSYFTTNKSKNVLFSNGNYTCRQSYDINISVDKDKFNNIIGFIQKYKTEKLEQLLNKPKKFTKKSKTNYEIISVDFISEEEVFDITVNNSPHTYWTGGLNVSNCAEATLESKEPCDLAEIYLNNINSEEQLIDCSKLLYKSQKAVLRLPSISEETVEVVRRNMRIGLGVTGICQSIEKIAWLSNAYEQLKNFDKEWSKKKGWNESVKLTVIKPSGTLSLLAGATPGVHPGYSRFHIRRVRMSSSDNLVKFCRELGYHTEYVLNFDGTENRDTIIVEFPCEFNENTIVAKDMSAVRQLELVKSLQTEWADQAVSVTVYYKPDELQSIKDWLRDNYKDSLKSVSFLLHAEHGFRQAPYEEIDENEYKRIIKRVKPLISINTIGGMLDINECINGACPVR